MFCGLVVVVVVGCEPGVVVGCEPGVVVGCEPGVVGGCEPGVVGLSVESSSGSGGINRPPRVLPTNTDLEGGGSVMLSTTSNADIVLVGMLVGLFST